MKELWIADCGPFNCRKTGNGINGHSAKKNPEEIYLIKLICVSASPFKLFPFVFDL